MIYLIKTYEGTVPKCLLDVSFLVEDELIENRDCYSEQGLIGAKKIISVSNHADLMNAELQNFDAIIWDAPYSSILHNIIPKKEKYGWQLQSLNTAFFIKVSSLAEFKSFESLDYSGIYSDNLKLLIDIAELDTNE